MSAKPKEPPEIPANPEPWPLNLAADPEPWPTREDSTAASNALMEAAEYYWHLQARLWRCEKRAEKIGTVSHYVNSEDYVPLTHESFVSLLMHVDDLDTTIESLTHYRDSIRDRAWMLWQWQEQEMFDGEAES
jgi:hypothetical protein